MSGRYSLRAVVVGALVVAATATTLPAAADGPEPRKGAVDKVLGELGDAVMEQFDAGGTAAGPPLPLLGEPAGAPDMTGVLTRLRELYRQAEEAGAAYRSIEAALRAQRSETARLNRAADRARGALALSRAEAGRIAREQYQGTSELSAYLELLLAREPQRALDQRHLIERAAAGRIATIARLEAGEKRSGELAAASRRALERELVLAARQQQARDRATARLRSAEGLLASLSAGELTALAAEHGTSSYAPPELPPGVTGGGSGAGTGGSGTEAGGSGTEAGGSKAGTGGGQALVTEDR
ncbi:hypothetical protein [Streptomyces sp. NPDC003023]|uniref:hypothetical protein n=1 Tax=Streptomyces sp. NPDC003023 TaxID=3364675 RepID=UPI003673BA90